MDGFDKEWNYIGSRNTASYTNIPPGHYTFKVKYKNTTGTWSPVTAELHLVIAPPFWGTWWFRTAAVLFILIGVYALFKIRIQSINSQKLILEEQVKERTESLKKMTIDERKSREAAERAREEAEKQAEAWSHTLQETQNEKAAVHP